MVSPISGEQCGMKVFYERGVLAGNGLFNTVPFLGSSSGNANLSLTVRLTAVPLVTQKGSCICLPCHLTISVIFPQYFIKSFNQDTLAVTVTLRLPMEYTPSFTTAL